MKVRISKIKVGRRVRKDLGELSSLEVSISRYGLLHPIVINQANELIAGARRLAACKNIGFKEVDVRVVNTKGNLDKLIIEGDENLLRKEFSAIELEKLVKLKSKLLSVGMYSRIVSFVKKVFSSVVLFVKKLFLRGRN